MKVISCLSELSVLRAVSSAFRNPDWSLMVWWFPLPQKAFLINSGGFLDSSSSEQVEVELGIVTSDQRKSQFWILGRWKEGSDE